MQPSQDALDFFDSLLIFDRICPFAIENLPIMSRRVFDVGLDMGRIRNGLKHNKENKRSKSYRSTATAKDDTHIDNTPVPNGQNALVPRVKHQKSSPTIGAQRDHGHNPPHDTAPLSSNQQEMDGDFPIPPSNRLSPDEQVNGTRERSLHSSQLHSSNGSPQQTQKSDNNYSTSSDHDQGFDLKPPPPKTKVKHIDTLSEQLFSGDHLRVILKDPSFFLRFTAFLNRYKPHSAPILVRYLEAQKAIKAVEYANALAETMKPAPGEHSSPCPAASVDPRFEARAKRSFDSLINDALPAYITNSLTKVVTESMVREITGTGMPVMRELVGGLAEVFCLADPSIKDCPIVYASEEFYRTTRYSRDDVLGRNCRFLQGPKTNKMSVARLGAATKNGQEICETVLNYRRDGSPFMNLLLTAPLYDNRGSVRYFIGAQIDVSGLIEDGRGLDSFERYLSENRANRNRDSDSSNESFSQKHLRTLNEFGQMLSLDESSLLTSHHSRASSLNDNASSINYSPRNGAPGRDPTLRRTRRVLGNDDDVDEKDKNAWALSSIGPSGKLPGVYQNVSFTPIPPRHLPHPYPHC
jgi:PAS domain S-box-containing protein